MTHHDSGEEGVTPAGVTHPATANSDFLAGAVLFAIALYTLATSVNMPFYGDSGVWGSPGLTPGLISAVLLLLSGLLMFRSRRLTLSGFGLSFGIERVRGIAVFALIVLYVAGIPLVGYPIATFAMLAIFQIGFAERRDLRSVIVWGLGLSAVLTVVLYYLFAELFFIPLPRGVFGV